MPRALIVADDLTGATDTAHAFAKRGYRTVVQITAGSDPPDTTVLAVNTDSRYADPETARERVRRAIVGTDAPVVYKKIDSTLRGNVGCEVRAAMDCGFDLALLAPASPAVGRLTAGDYQLVDGRLLTDTEYADDSNGPSSSHLPTLVEGVDISSHHLGIGTVAAGADAVREPIADAPRGTLFTCDATDDRHLDAIARAGDAVDERPLYVGSAGLAKHVEIPGEPDGDPRPITAEGGALGIVGSVSERSLGQLAALPGEWVFALDPEELLADPESTGYEAGRRATKRLADGEHAVLTAAPDRATVERTFELGRDAGLDENEIRRCVRNALAAAAHAGFESDPAGLFVTGGDVAMAVFDRLEVGSLVLSGEAIGAGIPVSRIDGGLADGTAAVTKAGGFGHEATAVNCLRSLGGDHE